MQLKGKKRDCTVSSWWFAQFALVPGAICKIIERRSVYFGGGQLILSGVESFSGSKSPVANSSLPKPTMVSNVNFPNSTTQAQSTTRNGPGGSDGGAGRQLQIAALQLQVAQLQLQIIQLQTPKAQSN
jgi:hypothetical protein